MKIGILGSGIVGQTLANGFIKHGYDVVIGTRKKEKLSEWKEKTGKGQIGNFADAASFGSIIVLAVKGTAVQDALSMAGAYNLNG